MSIPDRINTYIELALTQPFDWHRCNCLHFAAGWVYVVKGYSVLRGDLRAELADLHSFEDADHCIDSRLGCNHERAIYAQAGDIVRIPLQRKGRWLLGICVGMDLVVIRAAGDGLMYVPRELGAASWPLEMIQ